MSESRFSPGCIAILLLTLLGIILLSTGAVSATPSGAWDLFLRWLGVR